MDCTVYKRKFCFLEDLLDYRAIVVLDITGQITVVGPVILRGLRGNDG